MDRVGRYFAAIHPGEDIDLAADPATVEIARRTTAVVNEINMYVQTGFRDHT